MATVSHPRQLRNHGGEVVDRVARRRVGHRLLVHGNRSQSFDAVSTHCDANRKYCSSDGVSFALGSIQENCGSELERYHRSMRCDRGRSGSRPWRAGHLNRDSNDPNHRSIDAAGRICEYRCDACRVIRWHPWSPSTTRNAPLARSSCSGLKLTSIRFHSTRAAAQAFGRVAASLRRAGRKTSAPDI